MPAKVVVILLVLVVLVAAGCERHLPSVSPEPDSVPWVSIDEVRMPAAGLLEVDGRVLESSNATGQTYVQLRGPDSVYAGDGFDVKEGRFVARAFVRPEDAISCEYVVHLVRGRDEDRLVIDWDKRRWRVVNASGPGEWCPAK